MSDLDRHVIPCGPNSDSIEHDPNAGPFYTGNHIEGCWACESGVCVQRVDYENEFNGAKVYVHGILKQ